MKVLLSILCKLDSHTLSFLHTKYTFQATTKLFTRYASSTKLFARYASSTSSPTPPRNMFELYAKNSHWLGVYDRSPLKKEQLTQTFIEDSLDNEKEKNSIVDFEGLIDYESAVWTPESKRVGAIGVKLGCSSMWTKEGDRHVVTLIQVKDCHVIDTQLSREEGGKDLITQMILGAQDVTDEEALAKFSHEKIAWFNERGVFPKTFWSGFTCTKDALLLPGTEITASHFTPGQFVSVTGITVKHGFQGVMKRWGMKGQPASHGQTKTHRKMGATGGGQDPGRIFPGKRMAGHVGGKWRKTKPLKLFRVDRELNVLFVKGHVPGEKNSYVKIRDCGHREFAVPPPFPTHFKMEGDEETPSDVYADYVAGFKDTSLEFPPHKL